MKEIYLISILLATILSLFFTFYFVPLVIKKMEISSKTGKDVNKIEKPEIPEMGGIASFFAISLSMSISVGFVKIIDEMNSEVLLVTVSVMGLAALVGVLDDVSILGRKEKSLVNLFCIFTAYNIANK